MQGREKILKILDLARWAPSGDNTQPWRFEIVNDAHIVVHGFDTRAHCVYDLDGHASQISLGALLETIVIAATTQAMRTIIKRRTNVPETQPTFDVYFETDSAVQTDVLVATIQRRSVQRRPMRTRPLTAAEKQALIVAVGPHYRVIWLEGFMTRLRVAQLMFKNAKLRLTMPEAYEVHRNIIEWQARYSVDRVPDQALGTDPLTTALMRWVLHSWKRVEFFNRYLAGTWMPRIQMDLIPAMLCAAHFLIVARQAPTTLDDFVDAGRAVQRFWLTLTHLNLVMQPEITPLIFSRYVRAGVQFSQRPGMTDRATNLARQLDALVGEVSQSSVFMGRVGAGAQPAARSTRRAVTDMLMSQ